MSQYNFGVGDLTLISPATTAQAIQVGVLKDVSLDVSFTTKELRGAYQFPVDIARAGGKISGKAKSGLINGGVISAVLGTTPTTGSKIGVDNETSAIPASPYAVTVTNSATWLDDLGVFDNNTGLYMKRVDAAATPATGQYKVVAGVYTFAAADTLHSVSVSYSYTAAAVGQTNALVNQLMGSGTVYQLALYNTFRGKNMGVKLYAATIPKLSFAFKSEDYTEVDMDFEAFADASGKVIDFYTTE